MNVNLTKSNVALDAHFDPMLANLQANILKFHGRKFAYHLFFQFQPGKVDEAKNWLKDFVSGFPVIDADGNPILNHKGEPQIHKITSSKKQLTDSKAFKCDKSKSGGTIYTVSLTANGYKFLELPNELIPQQAQFQAGMRGSKDVLGDLPEEWEAEFQEQIDMLLIIAEDDPQLIEKLILSLIKSTSDFAVLIKTQRGNVLKTTIGVGIEHFGYADGVSQPMYLADEIHLQSQPRVWDDETPLDRLLVIEKNNVENANAFGSYFVFRKLEQNVLGFKDAARDNMGVQGSNPADIILPEVNNEEGHFNKELSGAMIVGRFENGTPVTLADDAISPNPHTLTNDFDYKGDLGLKCPYFAHTRLVNPRNGDLHADPNEVRTHRITRRAIPFDDHDEANKRFPDDKITEITEEMLARPNQPEGDVGLLFMCYQSDINVGFEELQGQWANTGVIDPNIVSKGKDNLIAQGKNANGTLIEDVSLTLPIQWGDGAQTDPFKFSGFVKMKGGEYFFTPSIYFLTKL